MRALLLALAASTAAAQSSAQLFYATCDPSSSAQRFTFVNNTVQWASAGSAPLCVTFDGNYNQPLTLAPCITPLSATQAWDYEPSPLFSFANPAGLCAGSDNACVQWSGQESGNCTSSPDPSPSLGVGCKVGTWPVSAPTSWNDQYAINSPADGMIQAMYVSGSGGPSPTNLCVAVVAAQPPPALPVPSPQVLTWSRDEMECLYDFDISIYTSNMQQGCACNAAPPPASMWQPTSLAVSDWVAAGVSAGCKVHILVAKHMCGFVSWPSTVGDADYGYNYSTAHVGSEPVDVVQLFVDAVRAVGGKVGMYYSLTNNARTNTCAGTMGPSPAPGQIGVTLDQYNGIVFGHLRELWSNYGALDELWFDGSFMASQQANLTALVAQLQPQAVGFNGLGVLANPVRWIGSESGYSPYPCWSTSDANEGAGDPNSAVWQPAETDFTVLQGDTWFYQSGVDVRPPAELRAMYEGSVGHNSNALLGLGVPPNGTVAGTAQAAAMAGLGAYVSGCYGQPLLQTSGNGTFFTLMPSAAVSIDRAVVSEDQTTGQRVRGWVMSFTLQNGSTIVFDQGSAVGNKKISTVTAPIEGVVMATLNITSVLPPPAPPSAAPTAAADAVTAAIRDFSLYSGCTALAARLDVEWEATWG